MNTYGAALSLSLIHISFGIRAEFIWLKEFKQYSPNPDIEVNGKKFQHMIGAVIHDKTLSANVPVGVNKVGSLSVTKSVIGEENCKEEFWFELRLPYHTSINGIYGDLEFHNGVAHFSLKDKETKMATNLPDGAMSVSYTHLQASTIYPRKTDKE